MYPRKLLGDLDLVFPLTAPLFVALSVAGVGGDWVAAVAIATASTVVFKGH